jgi:hypothetical protein
MMTAMDRAGGVPRSREELTAEWLTAALRTRGAIDRDATVTALEADRIGLGVGYVAQLWRVHPRYEPPMAGPSSLIAKLPPGEVDARSWWAGYVREQRFYRELAAAVPVRVPRCLGGAIDERARIAVTLLEDLGEPLVRTGAAPLPLAEAVVDALAALHSAFWQREPPSWLAPDGDTFDLLRDYTRSGTQHIARYAEGDPPIPQGLIDLAPTLPELVVAAFSSLREAPQTLVHGDMHPDNLIAASADDRDFLVIDWQGVAWHAGAFDLAYFLGQSLEPALRREHEGTLLRRYLEGLADGDATGYGDDELWRDYRLGLVVSLFSPVGWSAELRDAEERRDLDGPAGDEARAAVAHGVPLLRALADRNWRAVEDTRALDLL